MLLQSLLLIPGHHSIAAGLEGHPWKETQCLVYVGASNILLIPGDIEWMFQPIYTFGSLGKLQLWLQSPPITQQDLAAVSGLFPLGCCEHSYKYLELWSQQPNGKMSLVTTKYFLFPWSKSSSSMLTPFCCGFLRLWTLDGGWCIKLQVASIIGNWHGILSVKTSFWSACSISRSLFGEYRGRYSERDSRLPQCIFRGTILWRFCEARLWVKQSRWFVTDTNQESLGDKHAIMWIHVGPALLLVLHNTRNAWLVLKNSSSSSSSQHRIGEEKAEESGAAS
jgi:hypothetical protein